LALDDYVHCAAVLPLLLEYTSYERKDYPVIDKLRSSGYEVILSIGEVEENRIGSNCGQYVMQYLRARVAVGEGVTTIGKRDRDTYLSSPYDCFFEFEEGQHCQNSYYSLFQPPAF